MSIVFKLIAVMAVVFGVLGLIAPRIYDEITLSEIIVFSIITIAGVSYLIFT